MHLKNHMENISNINNKINFLKIIILNKSIININFINKIQMNI